MMREIMIGEQQVRVRATPLALLFYKQEFKSDILADLLKMIDVEKFMKNGSYNETDVIDLLERFDIVTVYQIVWAMAKADSFGQGQFPSFVQWFSQLNVENLYDQNVITSVIEEATDGFFRSGQGVRKGVK